MAIHGSHLWLEGVGSPLVFLSSTYNAERVCRTGQFALWIFGGSSPCPLGAFGVCSRAQDVVLDVEMDTPFHGSKGIAVRFSGTLAKSDRRHTAFAGQHIPRRPKGPSLPTVWSG